MSTRARINFGSFPEASPMFSAPFLQCELPFEFQICRSGKPLRSLFLFKKSLHCLPCLTDVPSTDQSVIDPVLTDGSFRGGVAMLWRPKLTSYRKWYLLVVGALSITKVEFSTRVPSFVSTRGDNAKRSTMHLTYFNQTKLNLMELNLIYLNQIYLNQIYLNQIYLNQI